MHGISIKSVEFLEVRFGPPFQEDCQVKSMRKAEIDFGETVYYKFLIVKSEDRL